MGLMLPAVEWWFVLSSVMRRTMPGMKKVKLAVILTDGEDGYVIAQVPVIPGCISQGKTRAEALANIKDAMTGYLASLKQHDEPVPPPISEEIVEIPA